MSRTGYGPTLTVITAAGLCAVLQPAAAQKPPAISQNLPAFPKELVEPQEVPEFLEAPGVSTPTTMRGAQPEPTNRPVMRESEIESDLPRLEPQATPGLRDTASSKTTISADALQSSNSQTTQDALRDVPGVSSADARGVGTAEALQVRGIKLNATTGYRLDGGLPIVNNIILVLDNKQRVEALKGAGALQFGLASAGGLVNYITKRAGDQPNLALATQLNSYGQAIGTVDAGARFGPDKQFGVRIVGGGGATGSFVPHAGGTRYLFGLAADWQPTDRLSFLVDYEYFGIDLVEQGAVQLNPACPVRAPTQVICPPGSAGRIILPGVPDPQKLRSGDWSVSRGYGENVLFRGRAVLGAGFEVIGDVGRSTAYRPERSPTQIGNYNVITGLGVGNATLVADQLTENKYANLELHQAYNWNWLSNLAALGTTYNQRDFNGPQNPSYNFLQNIYEPFAVAPPPPRSRARVTLPNNSWDEDVFVRDQIDLFERVHIFAGVRRIYYNANSKKPAGDTLKTKTQFNAPGFGTVIDIIPALSFYASWVKSLDETGQAPVNARNAYEVLPPAPAKQQEVGVKLNKVLGADTTLGYFWINRGNATTNPVTNIYSLNGGVTYEGIEATTVVPVGAGVVLNAGGQFMHATQHALSDLTINGKAPENSPVWSGSGGVTWRPSQIPGLRLNVGFQAVAPREANPQNQAKLPGFGIFNAGASYSTVLFGKRTSFNLTASNLLNNRYWSSVNSGQLGIGTPLTIAFSARTELF